MSARIIDFAAITNETIAGIAGKNMTTTPPLSGMCRATWSLTGLNTNPATFEIRIFPSVATRTSQLILSQDYVKSVDSDGVAIVYSNEFWLDGGVEIKVGIKSTNGSDTNVSGTIRLIDADPGSINVLTVLEATPLNQDNLNAASKQSWLGS